VAKDGTNRGGSRVRAGAKPEPLREKLAAGKPATRLADPEVFEGPDLPATDIGEGALLDGEAMPELSEYLSAVQRDGSDLLFEDLSARCAVEVMATKGRIIVAGEITSSVKVSIRAAVRRALTRAGNIKPDKAKSTEKIDGVVATIMALDRAIRNGSGHVSGSVYDQRGLLVL